jgi:formylglycine-generating enzyme required for sulfatase activity
MEVAAMRCLVCQKVIPDASRYCGYCGAATRPRRQLPAWWVIALLLLVGAAGGWGLAGARGVPTPQVIEKVVYVTPAPPKAVEPTKTTAPTRAAEPTKAPTKATEPTKGPSPTLPPAPIGIATQVAITDGMILLSVPAGEFLMGSADSDSDAQGDEKPPHKVYLDAFWIDRTEVTKDQYQKCVAAGKCAAPSCSGTGQGNHPVVCVSWQDATNYCAWAGRRLPTEAEWEKAARGPSTGSGDGPKYPWGNDAPDGRRLNYNNQVGTTTAVGAYPPGASPYGALDMAGNVWEWTGDWYNENYYRSALAQNPTGPTTGSYRVLRGGSWHDARRLVRAAYRLRLDPELRLVDLGFRCARSP